MANDQTKFPVVPIGKIHSPYKEAPTTPIQAQKNQSTTAEIEVFPAYAKGLADIEGFSHLILIYRFHKIQATKLRVIPYLDTTERGVFATRAPARPNFLGLSVVRLLKREGNRLVISGVDMLDGSPVIDIKPYIPDVDEVSSPIVSVGWLEPLKAGFADTRDDGRFQN